MNNKLGVNVSVVKTNENSNIGGVFTPMSKTEKEFWTYQIEDIYDVFISHVALGRNLTKENVDSIGQGRIWVADDALKIGLIDEIGGIDEALADAIDRAGVDEYEIVEYPKVKNFMEKFIEDFQMKAMQNRLGELYGTYENIQKLNNMNGIQARFVYDVDIH